MAIAVTTATNPTVLGTTGVASPGAISSVGTATNPTVLGTTGVASPGAISSVGTATNPTQVNLIPTTKTVAPPTTTAGSASSTASQYAPIISGAQTALEQALAALSTNNASVTSQAAQTAAGYNSNEAQQQIGYNQTLQQDAQGLTNAETAANTQGNSDITSLDRMLGSLGAGGSSVETQLIPELVDKSVQGNISGANTTKATDDQNATTAWNTFLDNLATQQNQLQQNVNTQQATNTADTAKIQAAINQIIAAAKGGTVDPSDLQYELQDEVDQIPAATPFTPTWSGATPTYTAPALSTYSLTPTQIAAASGTAAPVSGAAIIPWLAANQQQQTPVAA